VRRIKRGIKKDAKASQAIITDRAMDNGATARHEHPNYTIIEAMACRT
jgi:hypothetical protein